MGEVFLAEDTRLERCVVVKFLASDLARDRAALVRFRNEPETVAELFNSNVVILHDIGERDGRQLLVLENLEGETV